MKTREEEIEAKAEELSKTICADELTQLKTFKVLVEMALWVDEHPMYINTDNEQVIANLQAEIERLKNPWISVKDRLPEKHRQIKIKHGDADLDWISAEVFFMDDDGDCFVGMYDFGSEQWVINQDVFLYYHDVYDGGVITHWMPIPETPKGGES